MVTIIGNIYNFFFQLSEKKIEPFQFMQKKIVMLALMVTKINTFLYL
jgi:hypothetical protein